MRHETRAGSSRQRGPEGQLPVFDLGVTPYVPVQELQARLRAAVVEGRLPGVLLLLEHQPVITLGGRGAETDLHDIPLAHDRGVCIVSSERGGQTTLHAPGQLVSYPIVSIPHRDLGVYVRALEETLLAVLASLDVVAHRREGHPGLYVSGDKIASVGLRCQRWVASHGTSLNVNVDLSLFDLIVSCGEPHLRQTSLQAITGRSHDMTGIKALYAQAAHQVFAWKLSPIRAIPYEQVERELGLE